MNEVKVGEREDHRVRVARQKRERTRAHLLDSVLAVYPGERGATPAVIDDIIRHADVARGTFYKYFSSLEEAVSELGSRLADEMVDAITSIYEVLEHPVERSTMGFMLFLSRAVVDRQWAAFISHIGHMASRSQLLSRIRDDVSRGLQAGHYDVPSVDIAVDLVIGVQTEAIRQIIEGRGSRRYVEGMAEVMLRGLGLEPARSSHVVRVMSERLHCEAVEKLPWWREFN